MSKLSHRDPEQFDSDEYLRKIDEDASRLAADKEFEEWLSKRAREYHDEEDEIAGARS